MSDSSRYPRGFCGVSKLLFKVAMFFFARETAAGAAIRRQYKKRSAN